MSEAAPPLPRADRRAAEPVLAGLSAAGRAVPASLLAALPGLVFLAGFDHLAYGLGLLAGVVLAGLLIAPRVAGVGAQSITDALDRRFGKVAGLAGSVVVVLVVLPLLAAELAIVGRLAEASLGIPYLAAVIAALALAAAAALGLGAHGFARLGATAYILLAAAILVPLALLAFEAHGLVVPQMAYGRALTAIAALEDKLLEQGLVDFETFSAQTAAFLRLSGLDLFALVVSLALGTAVLLPLLQSFGATAPAGRVRLVGAWAALFVMVVLISVPALAAYAKLEIYGAMAEGTPLASLPRWLEAPLAADLAHVHGTSLAMLDEVARAVRDGAADPGAVGMRERWDALDEEVRRAVVAAAQALPPAASPADLWQAYVTRVLPAAAAAAGNDAAVLSQAALVLEPAGLLLAVPGLTGAPGLVAALIAAAVIAAGIVMAAALARGLLAALGLTAGALAGPPWRLALAAAVGVTSAAIAAIRPGELDAVVVSSLSLAAAGLLPALVGLVWKRATAVGAVAAIVAGASVSLYYEVSIQVFPAAFYTTWPGLSNAGEAAVEEFQAREDTWREAEDGEARRAAAEALDDWARGTPTRPGLANWAGIDSASSAVFAVPIGLAVLVLASLATSFRGPRPHP